MKTRYSKIKNVLMKFTNNPPPKKNAICGINIFKNNVKKIEQS